MRSTEAEDSLDHHRYQNILLYRILGERMKPTNLNECHEALTKMNLHDTDMTPPTLNFFLRSLRNSWGLWEDSPLKKYFIQQGFTHPDDMSEVIWDSYCAMREGKEFSLLEAAEKYKAYWAKNRGE